MQCFSIAFEEQLRRTGQEQLIEKLIQVSIPYEEQKMIRLDKQKETQYQQILKGLRF